MESDQEMEKNMTVINVYGNMTLNTAGMLSGDKETKKAEKYEPPIPLMGKERGKRGFEAVDETYDVKMPRRATKNSAGYDIYGLATKTIAPGETKVYSTNIKAYMQDDEVLKIYGRSSLAIEKGIVLATGVSIIDADYYDNEGNGGEILIALRNEGKRSVTIYRDQAIAQGIFQKYLTCGDEPEEIRRGGLGSTDCE